MLSKICNLSRTICSTIRSLTQKKGKFVGKDDNGNSYYESSKGKRWVTYSKISEPTTVTPEWHIWLHYSDNTVPIGSKRKGVKRVPNATGTENAYYPNQKFDNYYKSWSPDN